MELFIAATGRIRCLYGEDIPLNQLGSVTIRRASHVEPILALPGHEPGTEAWLVELWPVGGPQLGPFPSRSKALAAEAAWLLEQGVPATLLEAPMAGDEGRTLVT